MSTLKPPPLPRDTTRQSQGILYGRLNVKINRVCGFIIVAFLVLHIGGLAVVHWSALRPVLDLVPWLAEVHHKTWFHAIYAILFPAVLFHSLHSLKLIAMDLGLRIPFRAAFWVISALSIAAGLWGAFGDV
jgi:succinate dehydrogenase/fumarate reductase cytochrome b subunit